MSARTVKTFVLLTLPAALLFAAPSASEAQPSASQRSAGCRSSSIDSGRRIEKTISVAGTERTFILDVPGNLSPGQAVPLMFDFHGFGHSGAGVWAVSRFHHLAEEHRFITVYPTGLPVVLEFSGRKHRAAGWQMAPGKNNRDLAFTRAMLAMIEASYCIDRSRIYSTGFSNGAFFSSLLGCEMSETFAAVAPVSGGVLRSGCKPVRPVPILIQHGTRDEVVPLAMARAGRDQWLSANGCKTTQSGAADGARACKVYDSCRAGSVVVYCEEEFAHTWPAQATDRIWSFFQRTPGGVGRSGDSR